MIATSPRRIIKGGLFGLIVVIVTVDLEGVILELNLEK